MRLPEKPAQRIMPAGIEFALLNDSCVNDVEMHRFYFCTCQYESASQYLFVNRSNRSEKLFMNALGYGNLLLILSALFYVWHHWVRTDLIGRCASGLAALGASVVLWALLNHVIEHGLHGSELDNLNELAAFFTAITVVIYLIMERLYASRAVGMFVMLIVLVAVLLQLWLATQASAFRAMT